MGTGFSLPEPGAALETAALASMTNFLRDKLVEASHVELTAERFRLVEAIPAAGPAAGADGAVLQEQGQPYTDFFVLLTGTCEVRRDGVALGTCGPGETINDALLGSGAMHLSPVSVVATSPVRAYALAPGDVGELRLAGVSLPHTLTLRARLKSSLSQVAAFQHEWLPLLSVLMDTQEFAVGDVIIEEHDPTPPSEMFVLCEGSAHAVANGHALGKLPSGSVFGEVALLKRCRRTASIEALSDGFVLTLPVETFHALDGVLPGFHDALRGPAQRCLTASLWASVPALHLPGLGAGDLEQLVAHCSVRDFEAGDDLAVAGQLAFALDGSGVVVGHSELLAGVPLPQPQTAAQPCQTLLVRTEDASAVLLAHPALLERLRLSLPEAPRCCHGAICSVCHAATAELEARVRALEAQLRAADVEPEPWEGRCDPRSSHQVQPLPAADPASPPGRKSLSPKSGPRGVRRQASVGSSIDLRGAGTGASSPPHSVRPGPASKKGHSRRGSSLLRQGMDFDLIDLNKQDSVGGGADDLVDDTSSVLNSLSQLVPERVLMHLLRRRGTSPRLTESFDGAVLFADISGFSKLAEHLTEAYAPEHLSYKAGEDLSVFIGSSLEKTIATICAHGGDVIKFAGDAVTCVFSAKSFRSSLTHEGSLQAALLCAGLVSLQVLQLYLNAHGHKLSVHCGLGCGTLLGYHLGGVRDRWEYVVAGDPIRQIGVAEPAANGGEAVLSREAHECVADYVQGDVMAMGNFRLRAVHFDLNRMKFSAPRQVALLVAQLKHEGKRDVIRQLRKYIPRSVAMAIEEHRYDWASELRGVTACFVRVNGLLYRSEEDYERAQQAVVAVQSTVYEYCGSVMRFNVDDKGSNFLIAFGMMPLKDTDDCVRACRCGMALVERIRDLQLEGSVGIATGRVFCGTVGGDRRSEYTLHGTQVNLAARLMVQAGRLEDFVLVCPATHAASAHEVDFTERNVGKLKGFQGDVIVFKPIVKTQANNLQRLVGRVRALSSRAGPRSKKSRGIGYAEQHFEVVMAEILEKPMGSLVALRGAPGSGRRHLLSMLLSAAPPHVVIVPEKEEDRLADYLSEERVVVIGVNQAADALTLAWQLPLGFVVDMPTLSDAEIADALCHIVPGARTVDEDLVAALSNRSKGHVFFVTQLAEQALEYGLLHVDNDTGGLSGELSAVLPHAIVDALTARIDELDLSAQLVLKVAACIGQTFSLTMLKAVLPVHSLHESLERILSSMEAKGLVCAVGSENTFTFGHPLIRAAGYELLLFAQRRLIHQSIGVYMQTHDLSNARAMASHFLKAEAWELALRYHLQYAQQCADPLPVLRTAAALLDREEVAELGLDRRMQVLARLASCLCDAPATLEEGIAVYVDVLRLAGIGVPKRGLMRRVQLNLLSRDIPGRLASTPQSVVAQLRHVVPQLQRQAAEADPALSEFCELLATHLAHRRQSLHGHANSSRTLRNSASNGPQLDDAEIDEAHDRFDDSAAHAAERLQTPVGRALRTQHSAPLPQG